MENTSNIYNLIILDESGSMTVIAKEAVSGLNETIQTIRNAQKANPSQRHFITVVVFEGNGPKGVRTLCDRAPIEKVKEFTSEDYVPGGCTPLYDAMGLSISALAKVTLPSDPVLVTIITDGMENSSTEYSGEAIRNLVAQKRKMGWTFVYIGANQDAVEVAHNLAIKNAMNFDATKEGYEKMSYRYKVASTRCLAKMAEAPANSKTIRDMDDFFEND